MYAIVALSPEVDYEIRAACYGRMPRTKPEVARVAKRFGFLVIWHPRPFKGSESHRTEDYIHVPDILPGDYSTEWHIHELSHACERWEGREPYIIGEDAPPDVYHKIAKSVEKDFRRPRYTPDLQRGISNHAGEIYILMQEAGLKSVTIHTPRPGAYQVCTEALDD